MPKQFFLIFLAFNLILHVLVLDDVQENICTAFNKSTVIHGNGTTDEFCSTTKKARKVHILHYNVETLHPGSGTTCLF